MELLCTSALLISTRLPLRIPFLYMICCTNLGKITCKIIFHYVCTGPAVLIWVRLPYSEAVIFLCVQDLLFFRGYRWAGLKKKGKKTENRKTLDIVRDDQEDL